MMIHPTIHGRLLSPRGCLPLPPPGTPWGLLLVVLSTISTTTIASLSGNLVIQLHISRLFFSCPLLSHFHSNAIFPRQLLFWSSAIGCQVESSDVTTTLCLEYFTFGLSMFFYHFLLKSWVLNHHSLLEYFLFGLSTFFPRLLKCWSSISKPQICHLTTTTSGQFLKLFSSGMFFFIAKGNLYSFALTFIRLIWMFSNTKYGYWCMYA